MSASGVPDSGVPDSGVSASGVSESGAPCSEDDITVRLTNVVPGWQLIGASRRR